MHNQKSMNLQKIPPTVGLNIAKIDKSNAEFTFWDVGGQAVLRKIWSKYFAECHGLIFVIDGSDEIRFQEVKETISGLIQNESTIKSQPVLFLLNKNDKAEFKGADYVSEKCELTEVDLQDSVILPICALD